MGADQQAQWTEYYRRVYSAAPKPWIDHSNEASQAQFFAVAIEAAGAIAERRCLDVGCGLGQLATALLGLRASEVVGIDIVPEVIASRREEGSGIRWECGSPSDAAFVKSLGGFDIMVLIEVLQYVDLRSTMSTLWDSVHPGGRVVAVVPNKDNSLVQKVMSRFGGIYLPPDLAEVVALVASLPEVECWAYRGLEFQQDQRLVPYLAYPWGTTRRGPDPANRLVFAIKRRDGSTSEPGAPRSPAG